MMWLEPPQPLPSLADSIHLWWLGPVCTHQQAMDKALLSADEHQRAERFVVPAKQDEFIYYRAVLRRILGRYLNCAPAQLRFHYGNNGKPEILEAEFGFNLSHSGVYALLAVAEGDIGVDLEQARPRPTEMLANRFFSDQEQQQIKTAADPACAFHQVWTAKEAVLKAKGSGLTTSLSSFSVPVGVAGVCHLESVRYQVLPLEVESGFHAAACWPHQDRSPTLYRFRWSDEPDH